MTSINLGNGGTYCNGQTWYAFKPYRPRDLDGYKKVQQIGNLHNVWARAVDAGSYEKLFQCGECYTYLDEGEKCPDHPTAKPWLEHVQPRYSIQIPGWGSNTIGSELMIFEDSIDKDEFQRIYDFLRA